MRCTSAHSRLDQDVKDRTASFRGYILAQVRGLDEVIPTQLRAALQERAAAACL